MKKTKVIFERLVGESYSDQKIRFKEALSQVVTKMDKYYSEQTARKFPLADRVHIRNVKQRAVVDWDILKYWWGEYMAEEALMEA